MNSTPDWGWVKGGGVPFPFFVIGGSGVFPRENLDFYMQNNVFWCNFRVIFIVIQTTLKKKKKKKKFINFKNGLAGYIHSYVSEYNR